MMPPHDAAALRILLVSHTHWDREWYHPAGRFRQRLVALVDALLAEPPLPGSTFLLDGQTIVLEDYAAVRPEQVGVLRERLQRGAVEAGPWYVLADNLIPGGEAILRNLETGRSDLERWGTSAPPVAYCPDTFGHPAFMPALAAGYGFDVAIAWRGVGGGGDPADDAMWWSAPDGSRVLLHHLPPDGYETGSALPVSLAAAVERWTRLHTTLATRNRIGVTLLPNGADHHARQVGLGDALALASDVLAGSRARVESSSLAAAAAALLDAAATHESSGERLPEVLGELRNSYGYTWTLQGTFATRAHQKRRNALLERALVHDVEPWLALAWLHGVRAHPGAAQQAHTESDGRIGMPQLPALLCHAWRALLRTHPHDTLCGCSVDAVARAMETAQEDVSSQCIGMRAAALSLALRRNEVRARALPPDPQPRILVRNRSARSRGGVALVRVVETVADVAVGPGSARSARPAPALARPEREADAASHALARTRLGTLLMQPGRARLRHDRRESPQHYPDNDLVREHCVLAWLPPIPAHGVAVLRAGLRHEQYPDASSRRDPTPRPVHVDRIGDRLSIENGRLRLEISPRGVSVVKGSRVITDMLRLETQRDAGDSYTPSLRGQPVLLEVARIAVLTRGPLRGSCSLHWQMPGERSKRLRVRTVLSLDAESEVVRCHVALDNRMTDHRVRLVMRTDVAPHGATRADAAFGPVVRAPAVVPSNSQEVPPSTMPIHRWIGICDAHVGATLLSDGLAEGECSNGDLAVTLLRAIGELSRHDLPERPGHAGWPAAIPAAQCRGRYRATLGLLMHDAWSASTIDRIERAADELLLPLIGETVRDQGELPALLNGPALEGTGLRASAVTLARDGASLLLRAVNQTDEMQSGAWVLPRCGDDGGTWRVRRCRLDETPIAREPDTDSRVPFTIPPRGLLTLLIARSGG